MRLWSLHPRYLDARGLSALWREGLLAQRVLCDGTRGYRHHPQLLRFFSQPDACAAIGAYLREVQRESERRGYRFDAARIRARTRAQRMMVSRGQLDYELERLRMKLAKRNPEALRRIADVSEPEPHPLFDVVPGAVEDWEVLR